jgi:hypothetical protein
VRNDHEGGTVERINLLGRLARLSALGISMGMWPKEAVAHALEAENLKNYAAALGYTPGDVADFLELGLTIEQAKEAMCEGLRPESTLLDRANRVAGELTRKLGLDTLGLRLTFDDTPIPLLREDDRE